MKSKGILCMAAALVLIPATSFAQGPRNENLESVCSNTGSGMDPRCVGDTTPGTLSDMTTEREQRALQRGAPSAPVLAPAEGDRVIIERR